MEITQAIQDLNETVQLVASKRTIVRLHVRSVVGGNKSGVTARLYRMVGGVRQLPGLVPNNPGGTITVRTTPNRGVLNDSFYFIVPYAWIEGGSLTMQAELNPVVHNPSETTYADNFWTETESFLSTPQMRLREYNVRYRQGGVNRQASSTELYELRDWLRRAYPIDYLNFSERTLDMTWLGHRPTCDDVNLQLSLERIWNIFFNGGNTRTRYYGMVDDAGGFMRGCAVDIPSHVASGPTGSNATSFTWDNDGVSYGDWYGGHELGHTYGRPHAEFCGATGGAPYPYPGGRIGGPGATSRFYGFDIHFNDIVVYPPTWTDIMTYCNNEWMSDFSYEGIRSRLVGEGGTLAASGAERAPAAIEYLVLRGLVATSVPSATLETLYRVSTDIVLDGPVPSDWHIRLRNASNVLLADHPFTPKLSTDAEESPTPIGLLDEIVPFAAGTRLIEITKGDQVLATRQVSAAAPTVQVLTPNGGENIGQGDLVVTWQAGDADGDALSATILLSLDGGVTYQPLRGEVTGTTVTIPAAEVPGSTQARVRVLVSDGVNTTMDDSNANFTIPNRAPTARIITPLDGATYVISQTVAFTGEGVDPEEDSLDDSAYQWFSDIDGNLGTGPQIDTQNLSIGQHHIELHVMDQDGAMGHATITITVGTSIPPAAPALVLAPLTTSFVAELGSTTTQTETLSIRDAAEGQLSWTAASDAAWLKLAELTGDAPSDIMITGDPAGLATGTYTGTITLDSSSAGSPLPQRRVTVFMQIVPVEPPSIGIFLPLIKRD